MKIPSNNQWTQTNSGDTFGILHSTENVTFDKQGKLKLSRKPITVMSSVVDSDFGYLVGGVYYNNNYIMVTTGNSFSMDFSGGGVTELTGGPSAGNNSDVVMCFDRVYVTANTSISYYNGSWTNSIGTLTSGVPHPLAVFDSLTTYKLAVGNANLVKLYDSSGNLYSADSGFDLTLPDHYEVTTIRYRNGYLYVGTRHINGGEARVFVWDGVTANANYDIPVGASWVFAMTEYLNSVAFITNEGQLLLANGSAVQQLAALPIYYRSDDTWIGAGGLQLNGKVFNRGIVTIGDTIYINVNGETERGFNPDMKNGIWVYDPAVGLYHRANWSVDKATSDNALSLSSGTLTTSASHKLKTGDAVEFNTLSGLTGVEVGVKYLVDVISTNQIKLALTQKSLLAGNYVDIGGTPTGSDILVYTPNTDTQGGLSAAGGAIGKTVYKENSYYMWQSPIFWGARVRNLADTTTIYTVQTLSDALTIGRFTTQRISSDQIENSWKQIHTFIDGVKLDSEQIIVKVKDESLASYPTGKYSGTWVGTLQINSLPSTYPQQAWSDIAIGDELTFVDGYGRGYSAHVTDIETSDTVYSIFIDEDIGTNAGGVSFYADNFRKVATIDNTRPEQTYIKTPIGSNTAWLQVKCEIRGFETEVSHLELSSIVNKSGG